MKLAGNIRRFCWRASGRDAFLGIASCWIHRAKEEFAGEEGKSILKELGIEGDYEGIGHCILGYADQENKTAAPRKDHYIYRI